MTATAVRTTPYISGFCGLRLPPSSHRRCPQTAGQATCTCACHQICPSCGQQLPAAPTTRQETPR